MAKRISEDLNKALEKRDLNLAFTLVYYVISFGITFYLNFIFLFNSKLYFIPKFLIVVIISSLIYIFMTKHFLKFLGNADIGEDLSTCNSTAYILSIAVYILDSLIMFLLFILFLYFIGAIIGGIFTGQFTAIQSVF